MSRRINNNLIDIDTMTEICLINKYCSQKILLVLYDMN